MPAKASLVAMWRQGSDLPAPRQSVHGLLGALQLGGFAVACPDAYQSTTPQGHFSGTPVDLPSVDAATTLARQLQAGGVRTWPMVNTLGDPGEPALYAALGRALSQATGWRTPVVVDFEIYPKFFPNDLALARTHLLALDAAFRGAEVPWMLTIDPRQPGRDFPPGILPPGVPLILQIYHRSFEISIEEAIATYLAPGRWTNPVIPALQGDAPTVEIARGVDLSIAAGATTVVVWGLGSLVDAEAPGAVDDFSVLAERAGPYVDPFPQAPTPTPTPGFDLDAARDRLWSEAELLESNGSSWLAAAIKAAVALSKGER